MGVDLGSLFEKKRIELEDLSRKKIAIDAYNTLYQFLSTIRGKDGTPLCDSDGNITSHLSGLIYRTTNLIEAGIKPIFVFDGKPPDFKAKTLETRREIRKEAEKQWLEAKAAGREDAFKYARSSARIDDRIISDAKELLKYMGMPFVQAPSEGEAQACQLVISGNAHCVATQDYDSLLFGAPVLIRNLASDPKKLEMVELKKELERLGITRSQLIDIAMLIGTDYNEGIKGIGPKKGLKLIKKYGDIRKVLSSLRKEIKNVDEIKNFFMNPDVTEDYDISWNPPDKKKIMEFLCEKHDFSPSRVEKAVGKLVKKGQQTLERWA
ncbi:MAG: flap endonuclease-1 [Candidatus Syntropharchaeia archaeon]